MARSRNRIAAAVAAANIVLKPMDSPQFFGGTMD